MPRSGNVWKVGYILSFCTLIWISQSGSGSASKRHIFVCTTWGYYLKIACCSSKPAWSSSSCIVSLCFRNFFQHNPAPWLQNTTVWYITTTFTKIGKDLSGSSLINQEERKDVVKRESKRLWELLQDLSLELLDQLYDVPLFDITRKSGLAEALP